MINRDLIRRIPYKLSSIVHQEVNTMQVQSIVQHT